MTVDDGLFAGAETAAAADLDDALTGAGVGAASAGFAAGVAVSRLRLLLFI
jgi:hypothetical protein